MQLLACLVNLLGITVVTHCLSRRLATFEFNSWKALASITWPRTLALLIFVDSWTFVFSSAILTFGVGLEKDSSVCAAGIYLCVGFYTTSKLLIYTFLSERVHIVWSPATIRPRFQSPAYIFCFLTLILYLVIIAMMVFGQVHYFREDRQCMIGLKEFASIPLLAYDLYVNIFLTAMFLWPLTRFKVTSLALKALTRRTLVAACLALSTSSVNVIVLAVLKGSELGWVCLGSCTADVVVNSVAIFWVTQGSDSTSPSDIPTVMPKTPKVLQNRELGKQGDTFLSTRLDFATQEGMSTLSSRPGPPTPTTSNDEIIAEMRDIESRRKKRASSTFQALSSIGSIFSTRRDDRQIRSGGLQITVSTQYEGSNIELKARRDNEVESVISDHRRSKEFKDP